jgi:AcrR family transcriptional regulator
MYDPLPGPDDAKVMDRPGDRKDIPTLVKDPGLVERRRDQIVAAAVGLFIHKGFHRTTTREIARAAAFSIGTLYEYIQSKEDVLYLVCHAIHSAVEARIREAVGQGGTGREALAAALAGYFLVCDRMKDDILLIYQESSSLHPDSLKYVLANEERITEIFVEILRRGVTDGSLRPLDDSAIRLMADNIVVLGHMWTFRRWSLGRRYSLDQYTRLQTSLILSELAPEPGSPRSVGTFIEP